MGKATGNQEELELEVKEEVTNEEKQLERQAQMAEKNAKQQLDAMKKVEITIPDDPLNPNDSVVPVGYNGIFYTIPRGVPTMVPEAIADIWRDSYNRTRVANQRIEDSTRKEVKIM
ncbi:hypothetical protein [Paenibacillus sp. Marseille-Q4541]|uniref:hypothetical protein n=1 Tax=Paenibacillus sp. Marseille-Q4541 TaxID=2831522 RepID=UPI001BACB994|nr:hypothetical protein [Paenibacillus sp. Marseille-Q4541]